MTGMVLKKDNFKVCLSMVLAFCEFYFCREHYIPALPGSQCRKSAQKRLQNHCKNSQCVI